MGEIEIRTLGGGKVILSGNKPYDGPKSRGDCRLREAVRAHVQASVGPISGSFTFPPGVISLEVLWVAPSAHRRFHTLVTCGMAERPMCPPPEAADFRFAELSVCLPTGWPIEPGPIDSSGTDCWPLALLARVAHYAHEHETWVWYGHTLGSPVQGESFAPDTRLTCVALGDNPNLPFRFRVLPMVDDRLIYILNMIPIYAEEQRLAMWRGTQELLDRLEKRRLSDRIDVHRPNVASHPIWARLGPPASILPFPRRMR
jgi:hypothetical protein